MTSPLSSTIRAFLDTPDRFAVVATVRDGRPHQAVVWYALRGDDLLVNGRTDRAWVRAARRQRWLSLTVADRYDYVVVSGPVTVVDEPTAAIADISDLARQYAQEPSDFEGQSRITVLVHPEQVVGHGALAES